MLAKIPIDILSELVLHFPCDWLFSDVQSANADRVHPKLLKIFPNIQRVVGKNSPYRWKIVKHFTVVSLVDANTPYEHTEWRLGEHLHRDGDLPAIIYANGDKKWCKDGLCHREGDLPAIIYANGGKEWYKHGKRHRDGDLPACIYANGDKYWFQDGKPHRDGEHN